LTVHHFFVRPGDVEDDVVTLGDSDAHHAVNVLRVQPGDRISVADGSGRVFDAVVTVVGERVEAAVRCVRDRPPSLPLLTLVQGVGKADKMDAVVQKSVEVGVRRIVPVMCERTVVRWGAGKREKAVRRWNEIARAAAKQCRSPWPTPVDEIVETLGAVHLVEPAIALDVDARTRLRDALPANPPDELTLVIGPEGGLSESEMGALLSAGAAAATLGPRILRTETAGPVAAALILYAYGSLG
jgi:16S rRNA (uracil1498-N3)-methyltransferase